MCALTRTRDTDEESMAERCGASQETWTGGGNDCHKFMHICVCAYYKTIITIILIAMCTVLSEFVVSTDYPFLSQAAYVINCLNDCIYYQCVCTRMLACMHFEYTCKKILICILKTIKFEYLFRMEQKIGSLNSAHLHINKYVNGRRFYCWD